MSNLRTVACLYRAADGFCEPTTLLVEMRDGKPYEAELGAPIMRTRTETVGGWGKLDGEVTVFERRGVGQWLIPSAVADTLAA